MAKTSLTHFIKIIKKLRSDRQKHVAAVAEIDAMLAELGLATEPAATVAAPRRGRPKGSMAKIDKPRGKRGSFGQTAEEFVLGLLAGKSLVTAEINAAWKVTGRGGNANNTLSKLVKEKKIKATAVIEGRGSSYSVV